ncbi:DNA-3-methyladenine glycosylase [Psychromicrobium silvestre]|uniref:Putative 3-methyladenine DNA glycosylase n=1 Tax=Psychromicrobium silvestre TaxID=1645614 RepID=A0A7Y9S5X9_9MICC|nr:DNA-3-methyladenine glycosylase [Psychromicrobium silvestre]NYE93817.1 DNA-3-methyladenine glycosylase [Psychromicrobium silvestre]
MSAELFELLSQDALTIAPLLLGATVSSEYDGGRVTVRLTEVEAYLGPETSAAPDPGSHSYRGRTPRNEVMFGPPGHLYVYFTYGMHFCGNVVCSPEGTSSAVLLRAGEVVEGLELARNRRSAARKNVAPIKAAKDHELANGPAKLASVLGWDRSANGQDLLNGGAVQLSLAPALGTALIASGPRVGVSGPGGTESYPWRFWIDADPTVSRYKAAVPRAKATRSKRTDVPH